jgi:3D (Asp-Asp-Asp) domain-containing protein
MGVLLRIALVLLTLFFIGCQGSSFTVSRDSRAGGHCVVRAGEYEMKVTAYCPCRRCCGRNADGVTASGHKIRGADAFVAADRRFAFGTEMIVPGYNNSRPVKVLDRGGAIEGNRLDVFFNSHREAVEWGVKYLTVRVMRN